jgi:hypothetical protein
MPADGRSAEEIRRQLADERAGLTDAVTGLREDVNSARRIPMIVGGALVAGLAAVAVVKAVRGRGDDDE